MQPAVTTDYCGSTIQGLFERSSICILLRSVTSFDMLQLWYSNWFSIVSVLCAQCLVHLAVDPFFMLSSIVELRRPGCGLHSWELHHLLKVFLGRFWSL